MNDLSFTKKKEPYQVRIKWVIYIFLIIFFALVQSLPGFPTFFGTSPILIIPIIVCISMFEGPVGGALSGIIGGFFWDLFDDRLFGFNALVLMGICLLIGLMSQLYVRNNIISSLLMIAAALVVQGGLDWFFNFVLVSEPEIFYILKHVFVPKILYSLILSPIIYGLMYLVAKVFRKKSS